ncbi:MAG: CoA pyrophosphatase [Alphaproteobacteria bacterium]|nr:CoA pyrophosphatase [Alphaproteobacteria bacterium]
MEPQHIFPDRKDLNFEDNLRKKLAAYQPQERGDYSLNPELFLPPPYRPAAVLVPLLKRDTGYTVLFTQRTAHLNAHAGQISFPGGGADETDRDPAATALREAAEEIGLLPQNAEILGTLDPYITRTGYRVAPVVGLIKTLQEWKPDSFEVEKIFEVPLDYILSPGALVCKKVTLEGRERNFYALTWQDFYIWGATAGMLRNFVDVIGDERL